MTFPYPLPESLRQLIETSSWTEIAVGKSSASVILLDTRKSGRYYLKVDSERPDSSLSEEAEKIVWAGERVSTAHVVLFERYERLEYLLLSEVPGLPAWHPSFADRMPELIPLLANGMQQLHSVEIAGCPFDERLDAKIEAARRRMMLDLVDESDFDESRLGRTAEDLFEELLATQPKQEDVVFTHGDFCLPNIIVDPDLTQINGFIDLGRAGIADRYQDLALATRSLTHNFGEGWEEMFYSRYGLETADRKRIEYYRLLDEFF